MPRSAPFSRGHDDMPRHDESIGAMGGDEAVGVPDGVAIED